VGEFENRGLLRQAKDERLNIGDELYCGVSVTALPAIGYSTGDPLDSIARSTKPGE